MSFNITRETAALRRLSIADLRQRFADLFGEPTRTGNRIWLIKRLVWRLQVLQEGDLSERARERIAELANDADLRLLPPRPPRAARQPNLEPALRPRGHLPSLDPRLPRPGAVLVRRYKGTILRVQVLERGFQYEDAIYPTLSAVAKAITGSHCNGYLFFGLKSRGAKR